MRNSKKVVTYFISIILSVILLIFILLIPYNYCNALGYQDAKVRKSMAGSLDTFFIGASHSSVGINTKVFDNRVGKNSYNLSFDAAFLYSLYELLSIEVERNNIETVYLEVSTDTLYKETSTLVSDLMTLAKLEPSKRIHYFFSRIKFIDYWKFLSKSLSSSLDAVNEMIFHKENYDKNNKGYCPNKVVDQTITEEVYNEIIYSKTLKSTINQESLLYLNKIYEMSVEKKFELVLYTAPVTSKYIIKYSNIDEIMEYYKEFAINKGLRFIDFNLIKNRKLIFDQKTHYADEGHLSTNGATVFTNVVCDLINNKSAYEFYSSYHEAVEAGLYKDF